MPKNIDATKSKMRSKSTRKPLRDVSNAKTAVKSANNFKKMSEEDGGQIGDDSLDRLLLVHSDLSSTLRQIDELVVQALQLTSNKVRKDIKQFADVLSDMQTSLKPWVPRFQKVLSTQSIGPEDRPEQSMHAVCVPTESTNAAIESPEQSKWESLVSPSPLVSWRAECNTEGGRQLFLLTPLPQTKTFKSKFQAASITALEKITSNEIAQPVSLFDSIGNLSDDLPESVSAKPPLNKVLDKRETIPETKCASPANYSNTNCSMFVMTPCLKMSPPKSCILLEPVSEFSRKKNQRVHICTPFPAARQNSTESLDSESSGSKASDDLTLKYPELFGIKINNLGNKMKAAEDSPKWIVSPPKTCVIMEPPDELLTDLENNCTLPKTSQPEEVRENHHQVECGIALKTHQQDISETFDLAESTPMTKEPMSSFRTGKHPGENTLKKELWTKFEAASTHAIRFNGPIIQKTTQNGFLDRLDEALDA
ncbi:hypothetical protein CDL12_01210 [Handroanthus impetiginosus]|uniref:Uncharacterized protein n=1 Tax=Handroanthus impetiginosus TaxID=429701 RepID=A0A2G9I8G4_9LAMI|nr:hypothetical protein CDL12_01210 [Handroanthus impetiginosus]